jgi:hypothetical protein
LRIAIKSSEETDVLIDLAGVDLKNASGEKPSGINSLRSSSPLAANAALIDHLTANAN